MNWHNKKINLFKKERDRLMISILVVGALGSIIAALGASVGGTLSIWVAQTASITAALIGWQELRNIDVIVRNYSKVVLELTILRDHWLNLTDKERTATEFYKLVRDCEEVLWAQNTEYIKSMQEALREHSFEEEANLVNNVVAKLNETAQQAKQGMADHVESITGRVVEETGQKDEQTLRARRMADAWEREIGHPLMRGAPNMIQLTLACALGLEARNPGFVWRAGRPKLAAWFDRIAARPSFTATAPPVAAAPAARQPGT